MVSDKWTKSAMRDGTVVAEVLLSLKQAEVKPVFPVIANLRWGIRQPRSRSTRCDGDSAKHSRCSPNTPLSWSDGSDGYESTSRRIHNGSSSVRSKSTEIGMAGVGPVFGDNEKSKRRKVADEQTHHQQDSETGFLLPDLNMMPSQNDNLNHYFSPHAESLYGCIRIS